MTETGVLVVGAGPAGLTVAVELARRGVPCRVVDRAPARPVTTGCYMLWPRTLDVLDLVGVPVGELAGRGVTLRRKVFHLGGESFSHGMGEADGRWRLPVTVPQPVTERFLAERLAALGVEVEWQAHLVDVAQDAAGAEVTLRHPGGTERARVGWVVLAQGVLGDGLRDALGFGWEHRAGPPVQIAHLDVDLTDALPLAPEEEHIYLADGRNIGFVPLPGGRHRLFVMGHDPDPGRWDPPSWAELAETVRETTGMRADPRDLGSGWRSRPEQSLARRFRSGRCFVVGESAKVAPMPVHGLNSGVQDAYDLGWKLAAVLAGTAEPWLLDTYDSERRAVARATLGEAARILAYGTHPDAEALHGPRVRTRTHDIRSQNEALLPEGPLCENAGELDGPGAGERLPDAALVAPGGDRVRVARLTGGAWTLLAFAGRGDRAGNGTGLVRLRSLAATYPETAFHVVSPADSPGGDGLLDLGATLHDAVAAREARVYLLRPDGRIGFRGALDDVDALRRHLARLFR